MRSNITVFFAGLFLLTYCGCGSAPSRVVPNLPAKNAGNAAVALLDADHDGALNPKELEKAPGLKVAFNQVDGDHDGKLTAGEIDRRVQQWADSQVGRMLVSCQVRRQGKPLANAEVRLVPEPFLGPSLQTAVGTTDQDGFAEISAPQSGDLPPGMSPGFYRVEITHADSLPATFNTATTLGAEIAIDAEAMQMGPLVFDLP